MSASPRLMATRSRSRRSARRSLKVGRRASSRYSSGATALDAQITLTQLSDFVLNITLLR